MSQKSSSCIKIRDKVRKRKKKFSRKKVVKMLAVMEAASQNASGSTTSANNVPVTPDSTNAQDFLSSGRTGRRNALPDILGQHAVVTSSDLPTKLEALSTSDESRDVKMHDQPGTSKS